jgi:hypothetical protein
VASYVVMQPEGRPAEDAVLVRDGFHLLAFVFPAIWFLFHRMWIEALAALLAALVLGALASFAGFGNAAPLLSLLVSLYFGLEAPAMRLAALRRRGWHEWGIVEADGADDAETRYLAELVPDVAGDAAASPQSSAHAPAQSSATPRPWTAARQAASSPSLLLGRPGRA